MLSKIVAKLRRTEDIKRLEARIEQLQGNLQRSKGTFAEQAEVASRIIWVFGTARVGSTWVGSLLGDALECRVWNEPYAGTLFSPTFYKLHWDTTVGGRKGSILSPQYRSVWLKSVRSLILDGAVARFPYLARGGYLVIKDPHGSVGAREVIDAVPESRILLIVRDPRDVVSSALDSSREGGWRKKTWEGTSDPLELCNIRAELYKDSIGAAKDAYDSHPVGRKSLVHYENLVDDTVSELSRVCRELGVGDHVQGLKAAVDARSWHNIEEGEKGAGKFYRRGSYGGWREDLSEEQALSIEQRTKTLMDDLGYQRFFT